MIPLSGTLTITQGPLQGAMLVREREREREREGERERERERERELQNICNKCLNEPKEYLYMRKCHLSREYFPKYELKILGRDFQF